MRKVWCLLVLLTVNPVFMVASDTAEAEVRSVIQRFQEALDRHDIGAIGELVSPDLVVLENGHRNNGWADFRDNHLLPEFKEPARASRWEFVKVAASPDMAWGYTKQTIEASGKDGKPAGYLLWSVYVLQRAGPTWKVTLLDWSVRRLSEAD